MNKKAKSNVVALRRAQYKSATDTDNGYRHQLLIRLYEEYGVPLQRFLRCHGVRREDLEDISQEVFTRLLEFDDLETRMASRSGSNIAFIFTMANNLLVDAFRRKKVRQAHELEERELSVDRNYEVTPERNVAASRELETIKKVIMAMRPTWRKAFILSRFKNMSYREISVSMDVSIRQVENYISQALSRLRKAQQQNNPPHQQPNPDSR